jgi:hypothetical protein
MANDDFTGLKNQLSAAREALLTMLHHVEKRGSDQQKLVKDTADAVSAQLAKMKAPAGKEAQFKELVETWNIFKKTRENELVPAFLKHAESIKIVGGVQRERIAKCQSLMDELLVSDDFAGVKTKLSAAREALLTMMHHAEKRGPDQQKQAKDTADAVSAQLAMAKAPAGLEAQFKELVETWNAFKETREKVLIPAFLKDAEATAIALDVQEERINKCHSLTSVLCN